MATTQQNRVIEHLRRSVLVRDGAGLSDGQLLECFIAGHEEAAFEAIVRRHGPMVLNVCRRLLRNSHDAEDAFQATFFVLARKASSIRSRELVSNWLYGVAYQTARKATVVAAKRQARERLMKEMPEPETATRDSTQDWQHILDEELHSLPDKYRSPMVLCDLEGKSRREAARQLGLAEGTLSSRLARARAMLAKRLRRQGVALSGGALATLLAQNTASAGVSASLLGATVKAATTTAAVSAKVALLADAVMKAMLFARLKTVAATLLLLGVVFGGGAVSYQAFAFPGTNDEAPQVRSTVRPAADDDLEKMQGTWTLAFPTGTSTPLCFAGVDETETPKILRITGSRLSTAEAGEGLTFTLDASTSPRRIDLKTADGRVVPGIYQINGDEMKLCVSIADRQARPTSFAGADRNADLVLWIFERPRPPEPIDPSSVPEPERDIVAGSKKSCFACHAHNWAPGQKSARSDRQRLQGTWQILTVTQPGSTVSDDAPGRVVIVDGDQWTAADSDIRSFTLNVGRKVKAIDLKMADGPVSHGIYRLDGDNLKISFPTDASKARPLSFAAAARDADMTTWILQRRR